MEDLKLIFASNLIRLRTSAGMKQSELGEQLNYSDKSISKWERAEALPDAAVHCRSGLSGWEASSLPSSSLKNP